MSIEKMRRVDDWDDWDEWITRTSQGLLKMEEGLMDWETRGLRE